MQIRKKWLDQFKNVFLQTFVRILFGNFLTIFVVNPIKWLNHCILLSMMPLSLHTYSPIVGFINYICLLPEIVHDAALPCQHQRHIFPYRRIHQLQLLDI
jgi:hypothetical protein